MQNEFLLTFYKLSKLTLYTVTIICLTMSSILANNGAAQVKSVKEAVVSIELNDVSLSEALHRIEQKTDYHFILSKEKVDLKKRLTIGDYKGSVEGLLLGISKEANVSFRQINENIDVKTISISRSPEVKVEMVEQISISGTVTDEKGEGLPGATIQEKGTTNGTITDVEGSFSLNVQDNSSLIVSFVGYQTNEIQVNGRTKIGIQLVPDLSSLDEVVVVGYGIQEKANMTGAVSTVSSNVLMERPTTNATNLLQGRIPGLQVTQSSGQPGKDDAIFQIRGLGSFGASSAPLVLIDGIMGSLSDISPNDIENISVLKDAASASIYGSRAANGVILVTTKEAKEGTSFEYNLDIGRHSATRLPEGITNSAKYMEMSNTGYQRSGLTPLYTQDQIDAYANATNDPQYPSFDWLDYYFNPATVVNHYLGFSSSSAKSSVRLSLNYLDQEGILPNINHQRYNVQLNLSTKINDRIVIGTNTRAVYKNSLEPPFWDPSAVRHTFQNPLFRPTLPDGSGRKTAWGYPNEGQDAISPVAFSNGSNTTKHYAINSKVFMNVDIIDGLKWSINAGINYANDFTKSHIFKTNEHYYYHKLSGESDYSLNPAVTAPLGSALQDYYSISTIPTVYSVLSYDKKIGKNHNLQAMVGYEQQSMMFRFIQGSKEQFPTNDLKELSAGANDGQNLLGSSSEWALRSYFGRLAYNFNERYLIEANLRYDGTSRVADAHRWGVFPSVSGAWRISEEDFVSNNVSWLDELKIRGSWGVLGNQEIGNYAYQDILNLVRYPFNENQSQGVTLTRLTDKNLQWESTRIIDFGIDLDIFQGAFGMSFDWYKKNTYDILAVQPVPGSLGLSGPTTNDGELQNNGLEIELRHRKTIGDFSYNVNFMVSSYQNELLSIVTPTKGIREEGLPYNSYFLYEMEGIFQSDDDISNSADHIFYTPKPGDIKIKDQNGDNVIDEDDRISISPFPDFNYSFRVNLGWRNFNLSAFFQGVEGLNSWVYGWGYDPFVQSGFLPERFEDAWSPTNPSNTTPALYKGEGWISGYPGVYAYTSTYHLQDASFLRLKNLNISYNIPDAIVEKLKLGALKIYISGDNLLTFTKYPGLDPERPAVGPGGGRAAVFPQVRILNAGMNIKF